MRRFVFFTLALVGCRHELAQPWCVEDPNYPRCFESASGGDTGLAETGDADVPEADTKPPSCADAGPASEPCGKCGTRTRTCVADGTWSEWGACEAEGVCTPDEVETLATACPGALEKRTRKCSATCAWEAEVCALPRGWTAIAEAPTGFEGRLTASVVWTGGEMITYGGGQQLDGTSEVALKDGAIYSLHKNAWELLPAASFLTTGRKRHTAVWNGKAEMIVWGGINADVARADGAAYHTISKSWTALPAAPIAARANHCAVWSPPTSEMIVWGGVAGSTRFADGAAFDTSTRTWSKLPAAPISARHAHVCVWTGSEMLVWGGSGAPSVPDDGALYDPVKKTWRVLPPSGKTTRLWPYAGASTALFAWFGGYADPVPNDGGLLTLGATPAWSDLPPPSAALLPPRTGGASWFDGERLTIWSGASYSPDVVFETSGAVFDTKTKAWSALDVTGAPLARTFPTVATTQWGAVVWSGYGKPGGGIVELLRTGAIHVR